MHGLYRAFFILVKIFADGALVVLLDYFDNDGIIRLNGFFQYFILSVGLIQCFLVVCYLGPYLFQRGRGHVFILAQEMKCLADAGGLYSLHCVSPPSVGLRL